MRHPAYSKYKPSGEEWLGLLPEHWRIKRLKYAASINDEALSETTKPTLEIEYIDIGSVDRHRGITKTERMLFEDSPSRARRIVRAGDIIVSTVRTYLRAIAPIRVTNGILIASTGFSVVRPQSVNAEYLSYALREYGLVETIVARSVGVSYPAVSPSNIGTIPIPIPPSPEQQKIADFLGNSTAKLNALVAKKRKLIDKLKEKRIALISRTVTRGLPPEAARDARLDPHPKLSPTEIEWLDEVPEHWDIIPVSRLASAIQTGPFGSQLHESDYVDGGLPLINPAHIVEGDLIPDEKSSVDSETALRLGRHRLKEGDILMGRRGEIGRCGVVTAQEEGWLCGTGSLVVRIAFGEPSYFGRVFRSIGFSKQLELNAVGTTMLNINPRIVGKMSVPRPPIREQRAISKFLDQETAKIDQMVSKVESAIELLQEYRSALITAAVTGKIDVREASQRLQPAGLRVPEGTGAI